MVWSNDTLRLALDNESKKVGELQTALDTESEKLANLRTDYEGLQGRYRDLRDRLIEAENTVRVLQDYSDYVRKDVFNDTWNALSSEIASNKLLVAKCSSLNKTIKELEAKLATNEAKKTTKRYVPIRCGRCGDTMRKNTRNIFIGMKPTEYMYQCTSCCACRVIDASKIRKVSKSAAV